jgi:serine/threonine-protein kinase
MTPPSSSQPFQLGPVGGERPSPRLDKDPFTGLDFPAPPAPVKAPSADVVLLGPSSDPPLTMASAPPMPHSPRFEKAEVNPASFMPPPRKKGLSKGAMMGIAALVIVAAAVPSVAYFRAKHAAAAPAPVAVPVVTEGSATIVSRPDGAEVLIDGVSKGVTPLKLTLPVGTYTLELHNGASKRTVPLQIESGSSVRQYVDLAPADAGVGRIDVASDPSGAQVTVDGTPRGVTPLVLTSIEPGQHRVAVVSGDNTVSRLVTVSAGATSSVLLSLAPSGAAGGWVAIKAPFEMTVLENGKTIGTTGMDSLMLPAGAHELEITSTAYSFSTTMTVKVLPGKTVMLPVALPKGTLSINALPWADVTLDGQSMGQTPLGNLSVTIGNHEVVWRHPQLGERRQTVKVTAGAPVRAGMDLTK